MPVLYYTDGLFSSNPPVYLGGSDVRVPFAKERWGIQMIFFPHGSCSFLQMLLNGVVAQSLVGPLIQDVFKMILNVNEVHLHNLF